ncbi:hypothetical protein WE348_20425 (plasmid) [Alteromonas macleodii]|uniref:hypothetical protein n=1 Tax=Alteromonas macleodii TaxID=28108 RepID=UPI0030CC0994
MENSEKYVDCRNHINCGSYANLGSEYCEDCLEEQAEIEAEKEKQRSAITDLKNALAFFDKVQSGSADDAVAVGTDHYNWLEKAARKVVELN